MMNLRLHNAVSGVVFSTAARKRNDNGSFAVWTKGLIIHNNLLMRWVNGNANSEFIARVKGFVRESHSTHKKNMGSMDGRTTASPVQEQNSVSGIPGKGETIPNSIWRMSAAASVISAFHYALSLLTDIGLVYKDLISRVMKKTFGYIKWTESYVAEHLTTLTSAPDTRDFQDGWDYDTSPDIAFNSLSDGMVVNLRAVRYSPVVYRSKIAGDHNSEVIQMRLGDGTLHWIIMPNTVSGKNDLIKLVDDINWSTLYNTFEKGKVTYVHIPKFTIQGDYNPSPMTSKMEWNCSNSTTIATEFIDGVSWEEHEVIIIDKPFIFVSCDYNGAVEEMGMFFGPVNNQ
nr:MAG: hypothetical protein [Penaeus semisulcatus pemonivirus]